MVTGRGMASFRQSLATSASSASSIFEKAEKREREATRAILTQNKTRRTPRTRTCSTRVGETMLRDCKIERENPRLDKSSPNWRVDERRSVFASPTVGARQPGGAVRATPREHASFWPGSSPRDAQPRRIARRAYKPEFPSATTSVSCERRWPSTQAVGSVEYLEPSTTCAQQNGAHHRRDRRELVKPRDESTKRRRRERGGQDEKS